MDWMWSVTIKKSQVQGFCSEHLNDWWFYLLLWWSLEREWFWNSNAYNMSIRATLKKALLKRAVALKTLFWLVFLREISSMIQTQALGPREADGSSSSGLGLREEFPFIFLNIVPRILVYKYFSQTVNLGLFCLCIFNSHSPEWS